MELESAAGMCEGEGTTARGALAEGHDQSQCHHVGICAVASQCGLKVRETGSILI